MQVEAGVPAYQKTSGVSGNINSVGSDTMNNMMALWAEAFREDVPERQDPDRGQGLGSTAPPALIAGTAQFGPMSRAMKSTEIDQFEAKYGYKPTQIRTSLRRARRLREQGQPAREADARRRSTPSSRRRAAAAARTSTPGATSASPATGPAGRSRSTAATPPPAPTASSRSTCCRTATTRTRSRSSRARPRSSRASPRTASASATRGIGYRTSGVKAARSSPRGTGFFDGSYDERDSGKYPLSRFLYIYVNKAPGKPLDPLVKEYLKLILSKEGQEVVVKDGYLPAVRPAIVAEELKKLE